MNRFVVIIFPFFIRKFLETHKCFQKIFEKFQPPPPRKASAYTSNDKALTLITPNILNTFIIDIFLSMLIIDQNSKNIDFHEFSRDLLNTSHEHYYTTEHLQVKHRENHISHRTRTKQRV
jgi:hypothetical protein